MPNRYIREDAIESEAVNLLGWQAEVFWRRLLNRVDDFGRFTANPELLRASIFPLKLSKVSGADIVKLLLECEQAGLVSTYTAGDDKRFLVVHKWEQGRAKNSKYPPPPDDICKRLQTYVYMREQIPTDVPDSDTDSDTDPDNRAQARGAALDDGANSECEYPPPLNTPAFRAAWADWLAYRRERKLSVLKPRSVETKLAELSMWGEAAAIASIRQSIGNGWHGLFPPKADAPARPVPKPPQPMKLANL